jgi:hypothetical protein
LAKHNSINLLKQLTLWVVFILYVIVAWCTMSYHELWGDEIHSWNIAKGSISFFDLISNTSYEGHPPLWYIILWSISKFTHDPFSIQVAHLVIACLIVFIVLFFSHFPLYAKLLLPFGYFFLFEYSILSRNYAIGILIAFVICSIMHKNFRGKVFIYYLLLFLLSNTHLLSLVLAASFHLYFLLTLKEQHKKYKPLLNHALIGIAVFIPAVYFIFPPADSSLGTGYWLDRWNADQLSAIVHAPIRAFAPIPVFFEYHFWETNAMIGTGKVSYIPKWFTPVISATFIVGIIFMLKQNKKSMLYILSTLLLFFFISFIILFTNARHVGFIFIGFLVALWFYCQFKPLSKLQNFILILLLSLQVLGGIIAVSKDIKYTFSNNYKVNELIEKVPAQEKIVTDYWCLNTLSTFTDKPYYCVDLQREVSFLLWNNELATALKRTDRYSSGIISFMNKESIKKVYMISIQRLAKLPQLDNKLPELFNVKLIDKREEAMEKGSNLYLYEISLK